MSEDPISAPPKFGPFPARLVLSISAAIYAAAVGLVSLPNWQLAGAILGVTAASVAVGALGGFVLASPGTGSEESAKDAADKNGGVSRLGVFATWMTGAAFALAIEKRAALTSWFSEVTRQLALSGTDDVDELARYLVGSAMIVGAVLGFIVSFFVMATEGRSIFRAVSEMTRLSQGIKEVREETEQIRQKTEKAAQTAARANEETAATNKKLVHIGREMAEIKHQGAPPSGAVGPPSGAEAQMAEVERTLGELEASVRALRTTVAATASSSPTSVADGAR